MMTPKVHTKINKRDALQRLDVAAIALDKIRKIGYAAKYRTAQKAVLEMLDIAEDVLLEITK